MSLMNKIGQEVDKAFGGSINGKYIPGRQLAKQAVQAIPGEFNRFKQKLQGSQSAKTPSIAQRGLNALGASTSTQSKLLNSRPVKALGGGYVAPKPMNGYTNGRDQQGYTPEQNAAFDKKYGPTSNGIGVGYKKGGLVKKTERALVHKGEFVITKAKTDALMKKKDKCKECGMGKCDC